MANEPAVHITKKGGVKLTLTLTGAAMALIAAVRGGMWFANRERDFAEVQEKVGRVAQDTQSLTALYVKGQVDAEALATVGSGAELSCRCVCKPEQPGRGGRSGAVPAGASGPALPRAPGH